MVRELPPKRERDREKERNSSPEKCSVAAGFCGCYVEQDQSTIKKKKAPQKLNTGIGADTGSQADFVLEIKERNDTV